MPSITETQTDPSVLHKKKTQQTLGSELNHSHISQIEILNNMSIMGAVI